MDLQNVTRHGHNILVVVIPTTIGILLFYKSCLPRELSQGSAVAPIARRLPHCQSLTLKSISLRFAWLTKFWLLCYVLLYIVTQNYFVLIAEVY